jgi:hypothetical protein
MADGPAFFRVLGKDLADLLGDRLIDRRAIDAKGDA